MAEIWPDRAAGWRENARWAARAAVATALLVLVIALAATVAPRLFGYYSLAVTTGSMGAAAPRGGLVVARAKPASAVAPGDVILIERPGRSTVIHRVLAVEPTPEGLMARTGGDANSAPDPEPYPLPPQVVTKSVAFPYLGYLVSLLALPVGWLLLIALPATAVVLSIIRDFWMERGDAEASPSFRAADADREPAAPPEARPSEQGEAAARQLQAALAAALRELADVRERLARAEAALAAHAAAQPEPPVPSAEIEPAPEPPAPPPTHLLFVPTGGSYVLLEVSGAAPQPGAAFVASDGRQFVVSKVGPSPLPDDGRPCAYLQLA